MRVFFILFIILIFYYGQARFFSKNCFKNVSVDVKFSLQGIFEGESVELIEIFLNKKIMPIWWVSMKFLVSRNLLFKEERNENQGNDNYRKDNFFLMPYEKVERSYTVIGEKRGFYKIEEIDLATVDLFGINKVLMTNQCDSYIYVYPRLISTLDLKVQYKRLIGEIIAKRHIIEDPFQLRGIREYQPFDSIKSVNWSATAKTSELKVNQYDFTASQEVIIFLNVEKYNAWDSDELVEEGIRLAASIATEFINKGMKVGLISNGTDVITGELLNVKVGTGTNHNIDFYHNLARLDTKKTSIGLSTLIEAEEAKQFKEPLWLIVSHYYGKDLLDEYRFAKKRGFNVKWVLPKDIKTKLEVGAEDDLFLWEVRDL